MNFKNLMKSSTSHLMFLLCKSLATIYMINVRNVTNKITKKKMIKQISHCHY